jgi:transposase InsO family protein
MPWKETKPMDERVRFIAELSSCRYSMTELCWMYGISRKTGYKWARRYGEEGLDGLKNRSHRPARSPSRTDARCEAALVEERRSHPGWGARKLLARLQRRQPDWPWPSASTAAVILKRHGLVEARRRRARRESPGKPHVEATRANALWTADFKGQFRLGNHQLCYPLTVADRYSRFLLDCQVVPGTTYAATRRVFEKLFAEYGLPAAVLTDNGPPFAGYVSPRRLSRLAVWWIRLGIEPLHIQPGHPEQNGCHERMHRTLKAATARPPAADSPRQQARFDRFRNEYNTERPHEGIGMQRPQDLYRRSPRPYPSRLPPLEYPGHFELRRPNSRGAFRWQGQRLFISEVLHAETVGLEEVDDGLWSIYFGPVLLGRYDERTQDFDPL